LAAPASAVLWRVTKHHYLSYLGIVGKPNPTNVPPPVPPRNASIFDALNSNLDYSGGPVMPSTDNFVVVWKPASYSQNFDEGGASEFCGVANSQGQFTQTCLGYQDGLTQFFTDLAAASGQATNSDSVSTQYNDTAGHTAGGPSPGHYSGSWGGLLTDTDPYPASGCPGAPNNGVCLTDTQIQTELQKFLSQNGEPTGSMTHEYFLVTPPGVASCLGQDSHGVWQCSGNVNSGSPNVKAVFCAYHSMTATAGRYIYANVPDLNLVTGCDPYSSPSPSGNSADDCSFETCIWNQSTAEGIVSAISHEHNESLTDPEPNNAWTDWGSQTGGENGDKCNNDSLDDPNLVPDRSGGNDGFPQVTPYNEEINNHFYLIQREWSNDGEQCLDRWSLALGEVLPAPTFILAGRNGPTLTFNAGASCTGNVACPTGSEYVWQFNDNVSGGAPQNATIESTSPVISHRFPRRGAYVVALTVMGPSGASQGTARVVHVYVKPVVHIAASTNRVVGRSISFSSAGTTHDPALTIRSYLWHFGDGATSTAANPHHTYAHARSYTVSLKVTDSAGQTGTAAGTLTVRRP
jgi:chitodextrinase